MPPDQESNRIEELKKSLYSRNAPDVRTRRKLRFSDTEHKVKTSWDEPEEQGTGPVVLNTVYKNHSMSFLTKLLIGSAIFCAIALAAGAFLFFQGGNLISANNIDITVTGPVSIPGGEEVSFDVRVTNNNNVALQLADLEVNFPEGTTNPETPSQPFKVYRELLGDIPPGGSAQKTIKAIIFGEENLQKQITFNVTYKVKGSTSLFTKNKSYDILINSSPIVLKSSTFKEITSGQEFDITVELKSNSQQTLKNVLLKGQYPFGYTFKESNIPPLAGNTTWRIGDIPPGGERKVIIRGNLKGEDTDSRVFRFTVGAQSTTDPKAIGTQYMTTEQQVAIAKPFISTSISIDNDEASGPYAAQAGGQKRVKITWFNNLTTAVSNVEISAKLSGTAYDRGSIFVDNGYFRSSEDKIVWNRQTNSELASVGAGESGEVTFNLTLKDVRSSVTPVVNPIFTISANISGNRTGEGSVPNMITEAVSRSIHVSSNITLSGKTLRTTGPFVNTGPIPPQADQPTTYTIVWSVDNTSNPVSNAQVVATLPPNVTWLQKVSPSNASIDFDPNTSTITWNVGTVSTYTRNASRTKEVMFQVSIEPNVPQIGQTPTLVGAATLTARDDFANVTLTDKIEGLNTRFSTEQAFKNGDEVVKN